MGRAQITILTFVLVMGGWACSAQDVKIPFRQIAQDAKLMETPAILENELASSQSSSDLGFVDSSSNPSAAVSVRTTPSKAPRTITSSFWLLNGVHLGLASVDMALTQRCIANHKCREGNPIMPSSMGGMLSVNLSLFSYSSFVSYRQKKHESKVWWLSPAIGIASHSVGVATGLAHQ
jgi:hypothetical protein